MVRLLEESFDGFTAGGLAPIPEAGQLDSDVWRATGLSDEADPQFGGTYSSTSGDSDFGRGVISGDPTTAGLYALAAATPGNGAALMYQATAAEGREDGAIQARVQNTTGSVLDAVTIGFDWAFRNTGDRASSLVFEYSTDGGVTFTAVPAGAFATPAAQSGQTALYDSNTGANALNLSGLGIAADGFLDLRWRHDTSTGGGNVDEFGIDNVTVDTVGGGETGTRVSIGDATIVEGDDGTQTLTFTVTRSDNSGAFAVDYATSGGTATAGEDYDATNGTVSFAAGGDLTQTVSVTIRGDTVSEANETFNVNLGNVVNQSGEAILADGSATGTIQNDDVTKISQIQGTGAASTMVGQIVTVEAIVVGDFQNGDADGGRNLGGFYLQEELVDQDGNALSSEGVFVFGGDAAGLNVGDRVRVTATVTENFGLTQLNATNVTVVEAGAVADINTMAVEIDLPSAGVTLNQNGQYQPDLEAYEGMLVTIPETLTISEQFNLDRFNEIKLVAGDREAQFTHDNEPDAAGYQQHLQELGSRTITYDDGLNTQNQPIGNLDGFGPDYDTANAPRMGDTVTGLTGVLDYQWAGASASGSTWRVRSVEEGANEFVSANPREDAPEDVGGRLKVASFNVLNYFKMIDSIQEGSGSPDNPGDNTAGGFDPRGADGIAEFDRQTEKLVNVLATLDADVLGLLEIENDFLLGSSGNALQYLVDKLNEKLGSDVYACVDPGQQFVGGDAIAVACIYKQSTVAVSGNVAILDDSQVSAELLDQSELGAIFNGVNTSRAALAVTFEELSTGYEFTAAVNHLKSKSASADAPPTGADADALDGQGAWTNQRELAATALTHWIATDPTGSGDKDVLLLGDFNSYFREDTIDLIKSAGYENLQERLEDPYSYVFDGQTGSLDYIFANGDLAGEITGVTEWHINSDEADGLDYNTDFGRDPDIFDPDSVVRVSDHDPIIIGLNLTEEEAPVAENFKLQILHASDFEAGLGAVDRAKYFGAIVDYLEDTEENSITLSSGDNYLPSPFFNAGGDPAMKEAIETALEDYYDLAPGTLNLGASVGRADMAILNMLGIQASAIGNHEYDAGTREFQNIIGRTNVVDGASAGWLGAQFPYLSANTDFSGDPNLNPLYTSEIRDAASYNIDPTVDLPGSPTGLSAKKIAPATIITENGEKIGVVGATTQIVQSISSTGGIEIIGDNVDDMPALAAILQPTIDAMLAQGVNKIILVSHLQQLALEKALAPLLHGVDIIIAGGSHTLLADATDDLLPDDTAVDTYPLLTTNADGKALAIVNTDSEYSYVGRLVVEFDENGDLIADSVDPNVSGAYAADQETVDELYSNPLDIDGDGTTDTAFEHGSRGDLIGDVTNAVDAIITAQDGNIFGSSEVYLEGRREEIRQQETNLGNLSADANLWYAQQVDDTVLISIKNGGGVRDSIGRVEAVGGSSQELPPAANPDAGKQEGEISQLDIANSLRFNNALSLVTVTAAQLLLVLEHAVAATTSTATPGQFAQIGGVSFSFDDDLPTGQRVLSAALIDENGNPTMALVENGELVVDPAQAFRLVTLSFLLTGGDSYPFAQFIAANPAFANVVNLTPDLVPDADQVANFAAEGTEQDAFAEYLAEHYSEQAYNEVDTDRTGDTRIQNLDFRDDTVLQAEGIVQNGGAGSDTIVGGLGDDVISGGGGNDALRGHAGDDELRGDLGHDELNGGSGDDFLSGGAGDDQFFGGSGDDILLGGMRNDVLNGGDGDDVLVGGGNNDVMSGGEGADTFIFGPEFGRDRIVDFDPNFDTIGIVQELSESFDVYTNFLDLHASNVSYSVKNVDLNKDRLADGVEIASAAFGSVVLENWTVQSLTAAGHLSDGHIVGGWIG
ncbi:ExeM/NucH family extracellular endonuclease [Flaviflagellibacter deserti]|uniref:ExeM/NucH family extracellular endonuclease n=1 Tax=Flaviflagellibacter deserti TaxID=2267266 RepID=A0ABV9YX05_9HYPH